MIYMQLTLYILGSFNKKAMQKKKYDHVTTYSNNK